MEILKTAVGLVVLIFVVIFLSVAVISEDDWKKILFCLLVAGSVVGLVAIYGKYFATN
jgi:hypothetical protein